jgi:hypothetical protein
MATTQKTRLYAPLLALSGFFALAAVATILPWPGAGWENIFGYKSLCSFAPISTAICALLAGISCTLRARCAGPRRGEKRSWAAPVALALGLALVIGVAQPAYMKARIDARSGASVLSRE